MSGWRVWTWLLTLTLVVAGGPLGCMGAGPHGAGPNLVTGRISPAHFRFQPTVPLTSAGEPGWQAVCIHALMRKGDTGATDICHFEVGMPLRSHRDPLYVDPDRTRLLAATRANRAAFEVLSQAHPHELLAALCLRFRAHYQQLMQEEIGGSRVSACYSKGLEPVPFDVPIPVRP